MKETTIKINKIKIRQEFKDTPPSAAKLKEKYSYYLIQGHFKEPIIINKRYELTDGYTTYLLCKMFDIKVVRYYEKQKTLKEIWKELIGE